MLLLRDDELVVVDVSGAAPTKLGALSLPDTSGSTMLLSGDRVLVISPEGWNRAMPSGTASRRFVDQGVYPPYGQSTGLPATWLRLVDIADGANPRVLDAVRVDGQYLDARATGTGADTRTRLVVNATPASLPFVQGSAGTPSGDRATETNKAIVEQSSIDDWLPHVRSGATGTGNENAGRRPLLDCAAVNHPETFAGFDTLAVLTVDLGAGSLDLKDGTGILGDGQIVYASTRNLYVATPVQPDHLNPPTPGTTVAPGTTVTPTPTTTAAPTTTPPTTPTTAVTTPGSTPGTEPDATRSSPPDAESGATAPAVPGPPTDAVPVPMPEPQPAPAIPPEPSTALHRFAIDGTGPARYVASGVVPGTVADQFSMSEDGDTLRVTSTLQWGRSSSVSTLQATGTELRVVGTVGDIGRGEQVKAVRYVGNRGYVVTFRQTDPLYVLDLSNPSAPTIAGELKMLGYSAYLHPIGDGLLLGIGQEATEQGRTLGTKVALYDVSDASNPRVVQDHVLVGARSPAEDDHHAFLWWPTTNLALLPVGQQPVWGCMTPTPCAQPAAAFDGALGLTVAPGGITELGRIVSPWAGWTTGDIGPACPDSTCSFPFTTPIDRFVVVGDRVFSVSSAGVLSSELATLQPGPWLSLG